MSVDIYRSIIENSLSAIGFHKIICDEKGVPADYEFIELNPAYERLTGFEANDLVGKKVTEIFPEINNSKFDWIDTYGDIALNGKSKELKYFFDAINNYYNIKIYSPQKNYFITMFENIKPAHPPGGKSYEHKNIFIGDVIDFSEIQSVADEFTKITNIAMAIGNLDGELFVHTGFQNICENFHRHNSSSCENCVISDKKLFQSAMAGEYLQYKCLNHMWDISTPITVAGEIVGAIYLGQFFYDDDVIDYDEFRNQAKIYGFDEEEYMAALEKVPRVSHQYIDNVVNFYKEFANMVALLIYKNVDIMASQDKQKSLIAVLQKSENRLASVINNMPDVIMIYDKDYRVQYANESIYRLLGKHTENIVGKRAEEIWTRTDEKLHLPALRKALKTRKNQSIDLECECPEKQHKNLIFTYVPMMDKAGDIEILGIIHDYTARKQIEDEKNYQNTLISEMGRVAKIGGWEFNPVTGKGTWTEEVARIHELDPNDETNVALGISCYTDESKALIEQAIKEATENAKPYDLELELITKNGMKKWVRTIGQPTIENGKVVRVHGSFQDITQRKVNEERIRESEMRYKNLLETAPIGIAVHTEGKIVYANPAGLAMFGANSPEQLIGKSVFDIIHPSGHKKTKERIHRVLAGEKGLYPAEDLYVRLDGSTVPVEVMASPLNYNGKAAVQVIVTDITERKKAEDDLRYLSYHDQLTGIYNRRFFEEELVRVDNEENLPLTIVMADVNGLKLVNDSFGHAFGDELLIKAANAMKAECRTGDILARLGGDEFVLILPKTTSNQAEQFVRSIQEALRHEIIKPVALSVSFGYQTKAYKDEIIQDILANAENHMYKHKVYESSSMHSKSVDIVMNTLYEKSKRELLHSKRVSKLCEAIAIELNLGKDSVNQIKTAGLVHDIGKIGIDEKILNKMGKLNDEEWEEMRKHPERGWRILITSNEFSELADFVLEHQERWDGKGYPNGLKGNEISLEARIIALADAYDAMTSERAYRKAMSKNAAIKELSRCAGTQFDQDIVNIFIEKVLLRQDKKTI